MSEVQQKGLDEFFTKVDENMKFIKEELTSVRTNVADLQEKLFFTAGNRVDKYKN